MVRIFCWLANRNKTVQVRNTTWTNISALLYSCYDSSTTLPWCDLFLFFTSQLPWNSREHYWSEAHLNIITQIIKYLNVSCDQETEILWKLVAPAGWNKCLCHTELTAGRAGNQSPAEMPYTHLGKALSLKSVGHSCDTQQMSNSRCR